ncbi:MAG: sugar phosphate isomerase/epimerase family protein [Planctomycetota bacterium]|jgi:sugar phosphate isomerase/epimerase
MFGVSPAFVFSLYGKQFSVKDFCQALEVVKELGFEGFQPEIFTKEALPEWINSGSKTISTKAREFDLQATQFVAHFMMENFSTPEEVNSDSGLEDLKNVIEIAKHFDNCRVLTIPVGPFSIQWDQIQAMNPSWALDVKKRFVEKIHKFLELIKESGLVFALEILPFSVVGGIERFLLICNELNSPDLGINLDTGHAWACREIVPLLPFRLKDRIFGLHLCDNFSTENLSLAPGKGSIEWQPFIKNLLSSGYNGSFDIEIGCETEDVKSEYIAGLKYINSLVTS